MGTLKCLRLRQVFPRPSSMVTRRRRWQYQLRLNANSSGKQCFDSPALTKANDYFLLHVEAFWLGVRSFQQGPRFSPYFLFLHILSPKWVLAFDENRRRYNIIYLPYYYYYYTLTVRVDMAVHSCRLQIIRPRLKAVLALRLNNNLRIIRYSSQPISVLHNNNNNNNNII